VPERAVEALAGRKAKVQSWFLDLDMVRNYWGAERVYHHTAPISAVYALHEALRMVLAEGLDARFERHRRNHELLHAGLGQFAGNIWRTGLMGCSSTLNHVNMLLSALRTIMVQSV